MKASVMCLNMRESEYSIFSFALDHQGKVFLFLCHRKTEQILSGFFEYTDSASFGIVLLSRL